MILRINVIQRWATQKDKDMKAVLYNATDKNARTISLDPDDTLTGMQKAVEGNVECIVLDTLAPLNIDAWANDEGAVIGLPYAFSAKVNGHTTHLFGNVLFTKTNENGDTEGLNDKEAELVLDSLRHLN